MRDASGLERYTAPVFLLEPPNPNNVNTDARQQLQDTRVASILPERIQDKPQTVRVQQPINPVATVSVESASDGSYPTPWANLDDELRRQQLVQAPGRVRQLADATALQDADQLRITLGRLLPGEDLPDSVVAALGSQSSPEHRLLVALLSKLQATHTTAAESKAFRPSQRQVAIETQTDALEEAAVRRQVDPKAEATADLQQARQAASASAADRLLDEVHALDDIVRTRGRPPSSTDSELSSQLANLTLQDSPPPSSRPDSSASSASSASTTGSGLRAPRGRKGRAKAEPGPVAVSAQTREWERMRQKQPALFRLTMQSQRHAGVLHNYLREMRIPVVSLGRGGRFPTDYLRKAVLEWHDRQQLAGEGVDPDDQIIPDLRLAKPAKAAKASAAAKAAPRTKAAAKPRAKKPAPAPSSDASGAEDDGGDDDAGDEDESDTMRWDICTGEIGAGNNNPALLAEARAIARRQMKKRCINRCAVRQNRRASPLQAAELKTCAGEDAGSRTRACAEQSGDRRVLRPHAAVWWLYLAR